MSVQRFQMPSKRDEPELAPHAAHVGVQRPRIDQVLILPHGIEQLVPCDDASLVREQVYRQVEFLILRRAAIPSTQARRDSMSSLREEPKSKSFRLPDLRGRVTASMRASSS
jgi:hypothetical protein